MDVPFYIPDRYYLFWLKEDDMPIKVFDNLNNRPEYIGEAQNTESITEQAGYVPPNVMIENMINAGKRLNEARGIFDYEKEDVSPEDYDIDPTRRPGIDPAEVDMMNREAMNRLQQQQRNAVVEEVSEKSSQNVQEASGEV